jgi:hypothetical protein
MARSRFDAILIQRPAFAVTSPMLTAESGFLSQAQLLGRIPTRGYAAPEPEHLVAKVSTFCSFL